MSSRREFLGTVGAGLSILSSAGAQTPAAAGFSLTILATNWGFSGSWDEFARKVAADGYDGVEVWVMSDDRDRADFLTAMDRYRLKFGLLCGGGDANAEKHLTQFRQAIDRALLMKPLYINCHSGRDHFSFAQNRAFIDYGYQASRGTGVPVYHETHRGRILYSAPVARTFLEQIPELRLTLDISHWCNVHESLLGDQTETVNLALERTGYIHARVGHAEGPQVSDPRAPEWESAVKSHLSWWDQVVARKKKNGEAVTILTEFGPTDYMPAVPYTRQPLANQWEINVYMKELLRKRYLG